MLFKMFFFFCVKKLAALKTGKIKEWANTKICGTFNVNIC